MQLWKKAEYRKVQWINYNNLNTSKLKVRISTWMFHYNNCSIIKYVTILLNISKKRLEPIILFKTTILMIKAYLNIGHSSKFK